MTQTISRIRSAIRYAFSNAWSCLSTGYSLEDRYNTYHDGATAFAKGTPMPLHVIQSKALTEAWRDGLKLGRAVRQMEREEERDEYQRDVSDTYRK